MRKKEILKQLEVLRAKNACLKKTNMKLIEKSEELSKTVQWYKTNSDDTEEMFTKELEMRMKAEKNKEKAVNACRKYREQNIALKKRIALLENNLNSIMDSYSVNEKSLHKVVEANSVMAGKLSVYEKFKTEDGGTLV